MTFWHKFYAKMLFPIFLATLFSAHLGFQRALSFRWTQLFKQNPLPTSVRIFSLFQFVVIAFYTFIVSNVFQAFYCLRQPDGSYTMVEFPSSRCYDESWNKHIPALGLFGFLYGVAFPCTLAYIFWTNRKNIDATDFHLKCGSLISPYSRKYFYWEVVVLLKRSSFIVSNEFLSISQSYGERFFIAVILLFVFFWLDAVYSPYKSKGINFKKCSWDIVMIIVLLCQGLIFENVSPDGPAFRFLEVFILILLVGACVGSVLFIAKGRRNPHFEINQVALRLLSQDTRNEVFQVNSQESLSRDTYLLQPADQRLRKALPVELYHEFMMRQSDARSHSF
eukprot:TRINITY_DN4390_c0_g2_i3.p1 TRINITY_DN4390_c0_g2~~TRINITY_DN4390_c0_g2_i3.p1  ORF type:complete len:336 (+),score=53.15 TRINITY_DN4390_c0_g2_i3:448-1455(+)